MISFKNDADVRFLLLCLMGMVALGLLGLASMLW